jgi:hypothetical protein
MKAAEITTATKSTAHVIAKATNNIQKEQDFNLASSLRIANLEKDMKHQKQQTNKSNNRTKCAKTQKNSNGSQHLESVASPDTTTPSQNKSKERNSQIPRIVDLTTDNTEDTDSDQSHPHQNTKSKRQRYRKDSRGKTIKWKKNEVLKYNPETPANRQTKNPFQKTQQQAQPAGTMVFGRPHFHPSKLPYINPYQYTIVTPFGQPLTTSLNMNTQANTLHYPQTQAQTQYLQILNQPNPYLRSNPFQQNK